MERRGGVTSTSIEHSDYRDSVAISKSTCHVARLSRNSRCPNSRASSRESQLSDRGERERERGATISACSTIERLLRSTNFGAEVESSRGFLGTVIVGVVSNGSDGLRSRSIPSN